MELQAFIDRIQSSVLFEEEQKEYFTSQAGSLTPGARTKLIKSLEKHEQELIEFGKKGLEEQKAAKRAEMQKQIAHAQKVHEREVAEAEAQLLKDLENL